MQHKRLRRQPERQKNNERKENSISVYNLTNSCLLLLLNYVVGSHRIVKLNKIL
jgi:hypothetical protein